MLEPTLTQSSEERILTVAREQADYLGEELRRIGNDARVSALPGRVGGDDAPDRGTAVMTGHLRRCRDCRHFIIEHLVSEPGFHGGCIRCTCGNEFAGERFVA